MDVPKSHPRYRSLLARHKLTQGVEDGLVVLQGLIAQGRGEAFDYILGEKSIPPALEAERTAAAHLVLAARPVVSVNGNVAALAAEQIVRLSKVVPARIEVNLFYRSEMRMRKVTECLKMAGAKEVFGSRSDARIPGLKGSRAVCTRDGIFSADVVLVPLEDGDRTEALARMGKTVLAVDLNPMSRTSLAATVTMVDELTRALTNVTKCVRTMKNNHKLAAKTIRNFDRDANLEEVYSYMAKRLSRLRP